MFADFSEEKRLWQKGCEFVVGLDEVGRGPLAGPVVAAAVCINSSLRAPGCLLKDVQARDNPAEDADNNGIVSSSLDKFPFEGLNGPSGPVEGGAPRKDTWTEVRDSKKLSPKQRERWYKFLTKQPEIKWGIGLVSEKIIDQINILEATKLAMKRAIEALKIEPDYLLLDGNFLLEDLSISQKAVVRGDEKVISCAAASIIAKVTRDRLMGKYDAKYPDYGFKKHKGYGTKDHLAAIKKHGACPIHRLSFSPFS